MRKLFNNPIIAAYLWFNGLFTFSLAFFFATYVPFLAEKGMNLWQINVINAFFMFSIIFAEMPTGGFADRFGRHRSLLISCFLLAISFVVYYLSRSFFLFILAEVIGAIGQTFASGAAEAWLVDSLKMNNQIHLKDQVFRQELNSKTIGTIAGCLLGSLLGGIDLSLPWLGSASFMFLTGLLSWFFIKENYAKEMEQSRKHNVSHQIREAWHHGIKNKQLLYVMGIGCLLAFSIQALNMQWSLLFKNDYHFSSFNLGLLYVAISISVSIGGRLSKKLKEYHRNEKMALITPQLITALAIIACSRINGIFLVTGAFLVHELGRGIFSPIKQSYLNNYLQSERRATLLSLESMFVRLGSLTGLLVSGFMAEFLSIRFTWLFSGIVLGIGTVILIIAARKPAESEAIAN